MNSTNKTSNVVIHSTKNNNNANINFLHDKNNPPNYEELNIEKKENFDDDAAKKADTLKKDYLNCFK